MFVYIYILRCSDIGHPTTRLRHYVRISSQVVTQLCRVYVCIRHDYIGVTYDVLCVDGDGLLS